MISFRAGWLCLAWCFSAAYGQALSVGGKLKYHAMQTASPGFAAEMAAYAAVLHGFDTPAEWGQGGRAYGKRVASAAGATAIRNFFAFCLDSSLGEDPRYVRAGHGSVLRRMGHASRETFVSRTDSNRIRIPAWRTGSAIGAAFLSNAWYPDRLNTVSSGFEQAGATLGLDLLGNMASEFWPDLRRIIFRCAK